MTKGMEYLISERLALMRW